MSTFTVSYRQLIRPLSQPMLLLSAVLILWFFLPFSQLQDCAGLLFAVLCPFYLIYFALRDSKKAVLAAVSLLLSDTVYYAYGERHYSVIGILLFSLILLAVMRRMQLYYAFAASVFLSLTGGILLGTVQPYGMELLKRLADALQDKGALFGTVNSAYTLFVSDRLAELFYEKDYSQALYADGQIVSGAVNIFRVKPDSPVVSRYLTGQYFVNLFLTGGVLIALIKRVGGEMKAALISVCLLAILCGDTRLFALFLLLYNPMLYAAYLLLSFVTCLMPELLRLNIGFTQSASLPSLIRYGHSWGYVLALGFVLALLAYFASRLVLTRFPLSHGQYYPRQVRKIVSALGGDDNIRSVRNGKVTVKNPNLINILVLECEIKQDKITLLQDDFELIKDYFT